jgi:hypothetical protein
MYLVKIGGLLMAITIVDLECEFCHENFERVKSEHNRNQKYGRKIFCSLSCSAKQHNIEDPRLGIGNIKYFKGKHGVPLDEFSPFRKFHRSIRARTKTHIRKKGNITLQDLKDQWELQKGICPFTGWELELPVSTAKWRVDCPVNIKASIDRKDSSLGYDKGNVQFISPMANLAKGSLTKEDVINFCKAVVKNNEQRSNRQKI